MQQAVGPGPLSSAKWALLSLKNLPSTTQGRAIAYIASHRLTSPRHRLSIASIRLDKEDDFSEFIATYSRLVASLARCRR